jgi:hypothetical protein
MQNFCKNKFNPSFFVPIFSIMGQALQSGEERSGVIKAVKSLEKFPKLK